MVWGVSCKSLPSGSKLGCWKSEKYLVIIEMMS